jgi:hypothetical protein
MAWHDCFVLATSTFSNPDALFDRQQAQPRQYQQWSTLEEEPKEHD